MALYQLTLSILLMATMVALAQEHHEQGPPPDNDPNVKLVLIGMRHGNRNPGKYLKDDPNMGGQPGGKWGIEGDSELTNIGKRQAYAAGKRFRDHYKALLPDIYFPKQVKAYSSSANRCQMTLQTALAGAFPPKGQTDWNQALDWQPIPYSIDDKMLRMYSVQECTTGNDAWKPITDDNLPNLSQWLKNDSALIAYVANKTGFNASLSDMADVADNLMNLKMMNLPLPSWVLSSTMEGRMGQNLYDDILKFAEAHQIACAEYKPCGYMMGGLWINDLLNNLDAKTSDKQKDLKAVIYASHTEITLSAMKLMQMDQKECPTSAGFILEYRDIPDKSVRLIYHEPDPNNPDERHMYVSKLTTDCKGTLDTPSNGGWCPLADFIARLKPNAYQSWQETCKAPMPKECALAEPAKKGATTDTKLGQFWMASAMSALAFCFSF